MTEKDLTLEELDALGADATDPIKQQRVVNVLSARPLESLSKTEAMMLARSYLNLQEATSALKVLFIHAIPEHPVWHYRVGLAFYGSGLYVQALSAFRAARAMATVLEGEAFRYELDGYINETKARLQLPILERSFTAKAKHCWERFEQSEETLWSLFNEDKIPAMLQALQSCFQPLGFPGFEVAEVWVGENERRAQIAVRVQENDLIALTYTSLFSTAPEKYQSRWLFRVGVPRHPAMGEFFETFPYAVTGPEGTQLLRERPRSVLPKSKLTRTNAFALDLSGEKRQSAKIISESTFMPDLQAALLGEARQTCLNITWEVAKAPMTHPMTYEKVIEGLRRYYSEKVWDFYSAYTEENLPMYEFEMTYSLEEDPRRLIRHQANRLVDLYGQYETEENDLVAQCETMGAMPVSFLFDVPWEDAQRAVGYLEAILQKVIPGQWLRLGWGVGGVFMLDVLLTETSQEAYDALFKAIQDDPALELCLFNPIIKGIDPVMVKVSSHWLDAHPGVLNTKPTLN